MKSKKYLARIRNIALKIVQDQKKVEYYKSQLFRITQKFNKDRLPSTSGGNKARDIEETEAIIDLNREIERNLITLRREQLECYKTIYSMPDVLQQQVLISYYVDSLVEERPSVYRFKTWTDVSRELNRSEVWCQKTRREALKELDKLLTAKETNETDQ